MCVSVDPLVGIIGGSLLGVLVAVVALPLLLWVLTLGMRFFRLW